MVDLAGVLQAAVVALGKVIEGKPESVRLLAEMVRICGGALQAGGAAVWVTEGAAGRGGGRTGRN